MRGEGKSREKWEREREIVLLLEWLVHRWNASNKRLARLDSRTS